MMEKLAAHMQDEADRYAPVPEDDAVPVEVSAMQDAAKAWASSALETFTGELLTKALAISAAMAEFSAEYVTCDKANRLALRRD